MRFQFSPAENDQVTVWSADLDGTDSVTSYFTGTLSPDEIKRANRYRHKRDQDRFIKARGILRRLLGSYLDISPDRVRFEYGDHGKPFLNKQFGQLGFNISHSGRKALFAFSRDREVGVDIERRNATIEISKLAKYIFAGKELRSFCERSADEQLTTLYREWTRKEAIAKASGLGVSAFINSINPDLDTRIHHERFSAAAVPVDDDYFAAVAVEGALGIIKQRQWLHN
jgi:4'-phosphopantetheinyl transferase